MIQRSPTYVISNASLRRTISLYSEDGPPTEIADRLNASTSPPLSLALSVLGAQVNKTADKYVVPARERDLISLFTNFLTGSSLKAWLNAGSKPMTVFTGLVSLASSGLVAGATILTPALVALS
jgi:hypothetical protein